MEFDINTMLDELIIMSIEAENKTHGKLVKYLRQEFNISAFRALEVISKIGLILQEGVANDENL